MKQFFVILFSLISINLFADSWVEPKIKRYYSTDSSYFVEIVPTRIPAKYWDWKGEKPKKKHKYTAEDTSIVHSHAKMFRIENKDTIKVWEQKLINPHAPVTAFVSPKGKYLVTLDNWYSAGYGPDVFVVYNEKGELLKRYQLEDFSPFPINTYATSITSIWWRCGAEFLSQERLKVCFVNSDKKEKYKEYNLTMLEFDK
jgi:hypothetical protein